jgi:DNA polymerase-1
MKLKVYTDGFDGHCLRAFYYYREDMPDIEETVASINSIEQLYPDLRTDSKAPTFTLTYMGTYHSLMNDLGMEKEKALAVEQNYHELYKVSDEWVAAKLKQAEKDGYVTVAFGLRLRTPLLHSCFMDSDRTLYQAKAEGRSAGNALGQSYGMLNNRAGSELQARVLASEFATSILPIAHIHDAQYFLIRDDQAVIGYLNKHLLECMAWQELPEIQHDSVKLGGNLSLFHPTWAEETTIPEGLTGQQIATFIQEKLKNS